MHSFLVSSLGCENYPFGFIAIFYHFQNTIYFISIVNCDCVSVRILFFFAIGMLFLYSYILELFVVLWISWSFFLIARCYLVSLLIIYHNSSK